MPTVSKSPPTKTTAPTPNSRSSFFDQAVAVEEMGHSGYKFLVFGESGSGKTTLACSFPTPLLLVRPEEVEDGSLSVRTVKGVQVSPPMTDPDQLADVVQGQVASHRYATIVLDGLTSFQDLVVKKHMGLADVPVQMTWGIVPQADWNRIGIMVKDYLRDLMRLADAGTHVVLVSPERLVKGGSDEGRAIEELKPSVMAAVIPSLSGWIHKTTDFNVHTFKRKQTTEKVVKAGGKEVRQRVPTGQIEYCLHVGPSDLYETKFRKPKDMGIPDVLVNPTFTGLVALMGKD